MIRKTVSVEVEVEVTKDDVMRALKDFGPLDMVWTLQALGDIITVEDMRNVREFAGTVEYGRFCAIAQGIADRIAEAEESEPNATTTT